MRRLNAPKWDSEAELCAAFIAHAERKKTWRAYSETAGWDILMVRAADGLQVGIEAKLSLNIRVLEQALPEGARWSASVTGPDLRAILVPRFADGGLARIAAALGVTVITFDKGDHVTGRFSYGSPSRPGLPEADWELSHDWHPWAPMQRCVLPDYIPDVAAGSSAPVKLTDWKIKAIKLAVLLETRAVTRADFKALGLDPSRWTDRHTGWLVASDAGYRPGPGMPDFQAQHPRNYAEIKADIAKWAPAYSAPIGLPDLVASS